MEKFFKFIMIIPFIFYTVSATSYEEGTVFIDGKSIHFKPKVKHPTILRPRYRPRRPVLVPVLMNQDNHYYTTVENNCDKFIDMINEKDAEILKLTKKLNRLEAKEAKQMRKALKKKYDEEMEKFDNRKSSIKTTNSISISNQSDK